MARIIAVVAVAVACLSLVASTKEFTSSPRSSQAFEGKHESFTLVGHADPSDTLNLVFAIRHKNIRALERLLEDVSDPRSPHYTEYLTMEEIGQRFTDREAQATVESFLRANDIKFESTQNGDFVIAHPTVGQAAGVFKASFQVFSTPGPSSFGAMRWESDVQIKRTRSFTVPDEVAAAVDFVEHTTELPSLVRPNFVVHGAPKAMGGDVIPAVWQKYYNVPSTPVTPASGSSQSLFETGGQSYSPTDLTTYEKNFSVAQDPVKQVIGPNSPLACLLNPNNCAEASLDVEVIMAVAQGVPTTFWSIDGSDQTPFLDWAIAVGNTSDAPLVHSISYGGVEADEPVDTAQRFNTELMKLGVRGITVMIASGDDGVANFPARTNPNLCGFYPSYPATSPYATSVGATQGPESGQPEIACTSKTGGLITTGGGFSGIWPAPSWQKDAISNYTASGVKLPPASMYNTTGRGYPDVGLLGHNYIIVVVGQAFEGSGTSASTPLFAGFVSLVNNARLAAGKKPLGFLNPALYQAPTEIFHDITSGENNCCAGPNENCCPYGFFAAKGWDPLSGRGSVDFAKFKAHFESL